jgi:hypothetical protein
LLAYSHTDAEAQRLEELLREVEEADGENLDALLEE